MYNADRENVDRIEVFQMDRLNQDAASTINAAIEMAAERPAGDLDDNTVGTGKSCCFAEMIDPDAASGMETPPVADDILLRVLPVSIVSRDECGRTQIAPDSPSLAAWSHSEEEVALHLISWVNESGTVRDAIEKAIAGGANRFERQSLEYDDRLAQAGYDRFAPDVRACDRELRELHDSIQHAKEMLADTERW